MKSKATIVWFVLAVLLAGAIWILDHYFQRAEVVEKQVFPGLRADRVTGIEIIPGGSREIDLLRTNHIWVLQKPFAYPAQTAAVEGFLEAIQQLTPVMSFTAGDMSARKNADAEFGFDNPLYRLEITAGDQTWHVSVGNKTAPGDGVYVRVLGAPEAYVTGVNWLQSLPRDADGWRDTTLVDMPAVVDWLVITNGTQAIELRRDVTNRLWRMTRPLQSRANNLRIVSALQDLRSAQVLKFISDDPKADLAGYGLEPAALDVWLGSGTNLVTAIHVGKETNSPTGETFARREGWNTIVTTAKTPLAAWRGAVNDFRDPNLLELTAPIAEVEVHGQFSFTLQQRGSNVWVMAGEKFPVDLEKVAGFVRTLAGLRIVDFVQDVVTASGLQNYGLATPSQRITLRSVAGDTNGNQAQVLFGDINTNNGEVYVKRGDEDFVYAVAPENLGQLKVPAEFFRSAPVWNYALTNVAQVTVRQNGKMRQLARTGTNQWTVTAGQGMIMPAGVEETVYRLGNLTALAWIGRKADQNAGVTTNSLEVTVELKTGEKYAVDFGQLVDLSTLSAKSHLAVVTLEGERWGFIFPPLLDALVRENLSIPSDSP